MLHSASVHPNWGRWTILCAEPICVHDVTDLKGHDPLEALAAAIRPVRVASPAGVDIPFAGGWIGYLGYEAGRFMEELPSPPPSDIDLPTARFALYGSAALYDHLTRQWYVVGVELPEAGRSPLVGRAGVAFWKDLLQEADGAPLVMSIKDPAPRSLADIDACLARMRPSLTDEQFRAAVARAIQYIEAGDIYQVNLSRRLTTTLATTPLDLYLRLCAANPAWYSAYLDMGGQAVLSSSPELFIQVKDGHVITRPIKGTRPRTGEAADRLAVQDLLASPKDRAELTMIIDLQRNDLGRVCRYGSVRVVEPFTLEEHPTVYHLVGTITGQLRESYDAIDLLQATFPGGSITGAPKIRAMQIINELEPVVRSVYCGSIGCISLDGRMTMNIAIRTMIVDGRQVHLYVGAGIVADSQPDLELAETTAKARGMVRALM